MTEKALRPCPTCGEVAVAEIIYGMMSYEAYLELGEGAVLGGCCVGPERWQCTACDDTWVTESAPTSGR